MTRRPLLSKTGEKNAAQQPTSSIVRNVAPLSDDEILGVRRLLAAQKPGAPLPVGLYSITSDELEAVRRVIILDRHRDDEFSLRDWKDCYSRLAAMFNRLHVPIIKPDGSPQ